LTVDRVNTSAAELVAVLPKLRALRTRVELRPAEGGLKKGSYVIGEQVRKISAGASYGP
jgi:mRNA-degrading endonuclease toxin of MazEF toxin-antitoxin module